MNNFIRHSNKALLIATVAVGFGAWMSQINRANAVLVVGCADNLGSIGTGAGCVTPLAPIFTNTSCQLGTGPANVTYCCFYKHSNYYCINSAGARVLLGNKGDLMGAAPGVCLQSDSNNEFCVSYTTDELPMPTRGPRLLVGDG